MMLFKIQKRLLHLSIFIILSLKLISVGASVGDRTQFFRNCRENCERQNCTEDGINMQEHAVRYSPQSWVGIYWTWTCADECQYACVWKTVDAFLERRWQVPQFYGKWPFKRFLGLQEPASVIFSLLNLYYHIKMIREFRRQVQKDSPCYMLWHFFALICCNAWIWSTVFHARDFPVTELLDYVFAYSVILVTLYCMLMRMIFDLPLLLRGFVSIIFLSFYMNYFAYVALGKFSYSWNMTLNIGTAVLAAMGWFIWSFFVRKQRPYYKGIVRFFLLFGLCTSLEVLDFPPIMWILDAHAAWHLATAFLVPVFYNFVIQDCQALRKERVLRQFDKEI